MKCEMCQAQDASIHLTQVVDGEVKKVHLCEACAAASGLDMQSPMSITDILLGLGGEETKPTKLTATERTCPRCHLRRADFKKSGRLGCPDCYEAFARELEPVIRAMHRNDRHCGKIPEREESRVQKTVKSETLKLLLEEAIVAEDFEEAARLRDALLALRKEDGEAAPEA